MYGYQIKTLWEKLFEIHGLIQTQNWEQLKRVTQITDQTIEDAKFEIEEYPGEMTECPYDEFTDAVRLGDFDGSKVDCCFADFWFDGERSDLSMEFDAEFKSRELKQVYINHIHVF